MPSTWPAHEENVTHQISEPNSKQEIFERAQIIGSSQTSLLQSQPIYKGKTVKFEEFLSRSDSSDQSETSGVSSSGNAVDCFTAEYLLNEPATIYPAKSIEKDDISLKEDEPVASEVLLTAHVNELLARKRRRFEGLLIDEDFDPREQHRKN
ncbi:hypothetical protein Golomagni_04648 [Golovinomyces magnicellulatus]|nr:hypothetical protein Golomagni_04648 [Golovinomyces magnicellulatus]